MNKIISEACVSATQEDMFMNVIMSESVYL